MRSILVVAIIAVASAYCTPAFSAGDDRPMTYSEKFPDAKISKQRIANAKPPAKAERPATPARTRTPDTTEPQAATAYASLVNEARKYIGSGPVFGRTTLWCGRFTDYVLRKSGYRGGGDLASAYAKYGKRVSGPSVGAIAVMHRGRRGGHVGIVTAVLPNGSIRVISGNHNNRVAESVYPKGRAYAYVVPGV